MKHFEIPEVKAGCIAFGVTVTAVGLLMFLNRLDLIRPHDLTFYWPGLLVVFGLTRIVWPPRPGGEVTGMWIALVGGLLMLDRTGMAPIEESWPVFLIVAGLTVVFKAVGWLPDSRQMSYGGRWNGVRR
jgi:hypothetical protein